MREPEATNIARVVGFNKPKVQQFFDVYRDLLTSLPEIQASQVWNMDETGVSTVQKPGKIIATKGARQVAKVTIGEHGVNVIAICAMNAAGNYLPPVFIFPRKRMIDILMANAPPDAKGFSSSNGWTDNELFVKWLNHFVEFTNASNVNPQVVILVGHHSHKSLDAILFARDHGIHLITLPPHCTHKMQPLDCCYFRALKAAYNRSADSWMVANPGKRITVYDVAGLFKDAYLKTATQEKAIKGFQMCGLFPYNPNIFSDEDFCAADVTNEADPAIACNTQSGECIQQNRMTGHH